MKCVICHGDEIKIMEIKEEFTIDSDIIYVPVKIPVCKNCGERYYNRKTMKFLEEIQEKLARKEVKLKEIGKVLIYS